MSRSQRNRRRRRGRGRPRNKALLAMMVVRRSSPSPASRAVGYVISIAASAPPLDSLKPIELGLQSEVYAADGTRLGFIQSDELRTPGLAATRSRSTLKDATVAIEDQRFYQHNGVDYEGIVRAAVKNLEPGKTRPGRLDDHAAAGPQPLHRATRAHARAQDPRGEAGRGARERALASAGSSTST